MTRMTRYVLAVGALLAALVPGAVAQDAQMKLTGVNAGYVMGGVYTSPYAVTVTQNGVSTPMLLICDDFLTNIPTIPYTWSATQTDIAQIENGTSPTGTPKFASAQQDVTYATAAILASQLLAQPGNFYSAWAGQMSYAIWGVFDQVLLTNNPSSGEGHLGSSDLTAAQNYLIAAVNSATGATCAQLTCAEDILSGKTQASVTGSIPDLVVYTPNPLTASQEFLGIAMPEPGYPAILALDLLAAAGLIFAFRRRKVSAN